MADRKRTPVERRELNRMITDLEEMEIDMKCNAMTRSLIPPGWQSAELTAPCKPARQKITVTLDAEVVKWYRALGRGYQWRMNVILRAYMAGVISKEIEGKYDRDWRGDRI